MHSENTFEENSYEDLFYNRLTQLRSAKKVSARDMSLSIGQNPGYINGLENKKGLPSMTVFFYICDYLNVTPKEFFDESIICPEQFKNLCQDMKELRHDDLQLLWTLRPQKVPRAAVILQYCSPRHSFHFSFCTDSVT